MNRYRSRLVHWSKSISTYYVTSPIFYVNSKPHIGHLYSATLADVFKRYHDFKGIKTMYSIGTDEHGLKIQQQAEKEGMDTISLCNRISNDFKVECL
jgi:methionyl-tRNA synthetase